MKDNQHIVTAFDDDLSELNISLQNLGKMAITQFELSIDALATQHQNTLDKIIKDDVNLDDLEAAIHEKAFEIIAVRSPLAQDLRHVLVALKIATILERTGEPAQPFSFKHAIIEKKLRILGRTGITDVMRSAPFEAVPASGFKPEGPQPVVAHPAWASVP